MNECSQQCQGKDLARQTQFKASSLKVMNDFVDNAVLKWKSECERQINTCWNLYKSLYFSWKSKFKSSFWSPSRKFWLWMKFGITQWRKGSMSMTMASVGRKTLLMAFSPFVFLTCVKWQREYKREWSWIFRNPVPKDMGEEV